MAYETRQTDTLVIYFGHLVHTGLKDYLQFCSFLCNLCAERTPVSNAVIVNSLSNNSTQGLHGFAHAKFHFSALGQLLGNMD